MFTLLLLYVTATGAINPVKVEGFATHKACIAAMTHVVGDIERASEQAPRGVLLFSAHCLRLE